MRCETLVFLMSIMFTTVSGSPPGSEYIQEAPSYKPWEKIPGPPILPPHLLQVILNKDTPLSVSPSKFIDWDRDDSREFPMQL